METSYIVLADGALINSDHIVGFGGDAFVIRHGPDQVLKIPVLRGRHDHATGKIEPDPDNGHQAKHLEREKLIYARLREMPGIAHCVECNSNGILLQYYPNGSLEEYIDSHPDPPSMTQRMGWVLQATEIIVRCHKNKVLVYDIALRNFLLADDFTLRIIDFANSELLPEDTEDISLVVADGMTVAVDLLHLACVIYSIVTWQKFSIDDCMMESEWPDEERMPELEGVGFADVIRKCWMRQYASAQEVLEQVRLCVETSAMRSSEPCSTFPIFSLISNPKQPSQTNT